MDGQSVKTTERGGTRGFDADSSEENSLSVAM